MKKIIAAILLFAMALTLFSCGAKPELIELDSAKLSGIQLSALPTAEVDKKAFVDAYNAAEVTGAADEDDRSENDVIIATYTNGTDIMTIFYLGDAKFAVTGTKVEESYIIESEKLEELYNNTIDPQPEFVKIEGTYTASLVKAPTKEIDTAALVQYYMNSTLVGKAEDEKSNDTIVIICDDGETTFSISYLGDNLFRVSGSKVKVDYIIKSKGLADLYTEAIK